MFGLAAGSGGSYTALALPATASRQTARSRGDRAVLRLRRRALVGGARDAGGRLRRARTRPPDLRALPARSARRLRRRPGRARPDGGRRGRGRPRGGSAPGGRRRPLGAADRARDRLGEPVRDRAEPRARALPGPARRLLGRQLPARPGGGRPRGGGRGARPVRRAARRLRRAAPLGRVRDRRLRRGARVDAPAEPVHALRGRGLDLPGAEGCRVRPVPVRGRGRRRPSWPGCSRSARSPVGLGAGIAFQLAYPGDFGYALHEGGPALATWVALFGGAAAFVLGLVLPRRYTGLDRPGAIADRDGGAGGPPGRPARLHALGRAARAAERPDPGARRRTPRPRAREGGRVLRRPDELRDRRVRARVRRKRPPRARRRHEGEPALPAPRRRRGVLPHRRPRDPAPVRRDLARRRPEPLEAARLGLPQVVRRRGRYVLYRLPR